MMIDVSSDTCKEPTVSDNGEEEKGEIEGKKKEGKKRTFNKDNFLNQLMYNLHGQIIWIGDLNALHRVWGVGGSYTNQCGKALIQFLEHNITLISNGIPTSIHLNTSNPLDIAICSQTISLVSAWVVLSDCGFSDHYPTKCEINIKQNNKIEYSPYKTCNY